MTSTIRFLRQYLGPDPTAVAVQETTYDRAGEQLPATSYMPARSRRPLPGWILLHGLTVTGRRHRSLDRFARALAASGSVVMVPEVPEWCRLEVSPASSLATIRAAVLDLGRRDSILPGRLGLIGFSFGATQVLISAADPELAGLLSGVAAWGGYCDFHNLCRFGVSGEYELDGTSYRTEPDPYGRWLMLGNYLTSIPGYASYEATASALRQLALRAGQVGAYAADPVYDAVKLELAAGLPPDERELFGLVAPPAGQPPADPELARSLAARLADTALARDPLLDPKPFLPRVAAPAAIAHGRDDRLVPYTESIRLSRAIPPERTNGCVVTALFAHSGGAVERLGRLGLVRETVRFVSLLRRIIAIP